MPFPGHPDTDVESIELMWLSFGMMVYALSSLLSFSEKRLNVLLWCRKSMCYKSMVIL